MSRRNVTAKQYKFLSFIRSYVDEHNIWPTYSEICDAFGYQSPNSVTQNLTALRKKGFVRKGLDGYELVEKNQDGVIRVQGRVHQDTYETGNHELALSLPSLFSDFSTLSAVKLEESCYRSEELAEAEYILINNYDETRIGNPQVVVYEGKVLLARLKGKKTLHIEGKPNPVPVSDDKVQVLGPYAGHAGQYGIVRSDH